MRNITPNRAAFLGLAGGAAALPLLGASKQPLHFLLESKVSDLSTTLRPSAQLSWAAARAGFSYIVHPNGRDLLFTAPGVNRSMINIGSLLIPNCGVDNPCPTTPPGGGGGDVGGDGSSTDQLRVIGHVTAHTTFPVAPAQPSFNSYGYTGGGGVPQYPHSPYYGAPASKATACLFAGAEVAKVAYETNKFIAANSASVSASAARLIGVAAGTAVTTGEFLSVVILSIGPGEFALLLAAIGLTAFAAFELVRCATEGRGD